MSPAPAVPGPRSSHLLDAVEEWAALSGRRADPGDVVVLKESEKSQVYRLPGVAPDHGSVIAKRGATSSLLSERAIFEHLAARLPVPMVQLYAAVERNGFAWHFLTDAGDDHYEEADRDHASALADWLAAVHSTFAVASPVPLADRGPDRYLEHLHSARRLIQDGWSNPRITAAQRARLQEADSLLHGLSTIWSELAAVCAGMPPTLVHGDLKSKNVLVHRPGPASGGDGGGSTGGIRGHGYAVCPVDWEMSGWGTGACDLAALLRASDARWTPLDRYCQSRFGVDARDTDVPRLASVGTILGRVAAMDWSAADLETEWLDRPLKYLDVFTGQICSQLRDLGPPADLLLVR